MLRNDQLDQWDRDAFLPPLDPSRPVRARRDAEPDHHRRQRRLHRRPRRHQAARRLRRALLRQCRLWPHRDRRGDRHAGAGARLLPRLCRPRHRGLDHAGPHDPGARAEEHVARSISASAAPTPTRPTSSWSGTTTTSSAGRDKKKIISRWRGYHGSGLMTGSLTGLELFHKKFDLPLAAGDRTPRRPTTSAAPTRRCREEEFSAYCAAKLEELILREGPDTIAAFIGEPVLGTGGIVPPPEGLLGGDPGGAEEVRHPADRRRGGHRLRPARQHVRLRPLRHRARHHHHRQGPDLRLCAAVRLDHLGQGLEGAGARHRRARRRSAMAGPIRPIRSAPPPASPT